MIPKCCCCFDLRWGYYTYAVVIVGIRLSTLCLMYSGLSYLCISYPPSCDPNIKHFGWLMGWCFTAILYCFFAIAGIIKERSAMMYPCIVILIVELVSTTIFYLFVAIIATPYMLIVLFLSFCVYGYDLCCLISLYKKIKKAESSVIILSDCN